MTLVVDARDVDHAIETMEATLQCEYAARGDLDCDEASDRDPCAVHTALGLLHQARRFDAFEPPL